MRVLVLGAGGAASNGFTRALKMADKRAFTVGTNANVFDLELAETDKRESICLADDREFLGELNYLIEKHRINVVHAQSDEEVLALSKNRFQINAKTLLPSRKAVDRCQDKGRCATVFQERGVPCPESQILHSYETAEEVVAQMIAKHGEVWLRLRWGAGGNGALRTDNLGFAMAWIQHKGRHIYNWMVAEALDGDTVTVQQLWYEGTLIASQQRSRVSWANAKNAPTGVSGSTGIGMITSDEDPDIVAMKAVRSVDFRSPNGLYGVDMVWDRKTDPKVTEINAGRFFTTHSEFFASLATDRRHNMAYLYAHLALTGDHEWLEHPLINVLPDGKMWIRGMDSRPVLV